MKLILAPRVNAGKFSCLSAFSYYSINRSSLFFRSLKVGFAFDELAKSKHQREFLYLLTNSELFGALKLYFFLSKGYDRVTVD